MGIEGVVVVIEGLMVEERLLLGLLGGWFESLRGLRGRRVERVERVERARTTKAKKRMLTKKEKNNQYQAKRIDNK